MNCKSLTETFSPRTRRILLVQPWIADFAAYNFWIRPLGLYTLAEWLWERGAEITLVDCLSPARAPARFRRRPVPTPSVLGGFPRRFARYGISPDEFKRRIDKARPVDAVLITSGMSYWYIGVQWTIEAIKSTIRDRPIILGGIYPTLWPEHARRFSGADHVLPGTIQDIQEELADTLKLPASPRWPRRPWYELGLHDGADYSAIRTATGCPFNCTYCASRRLSGGFFSRSPSELIEEIDFLYRRGVRQIAFYDDALLAGFRDRLQPVLEYVVRRKMQIRFHTPNGLHARLLDREAANWMAKAGFATVRLSLETTNEKRQKETGNKVSTEEVADAVENLLMAGIPREAIGIYLLIGLPGQDLEEIRAGVEFVHSLGIRPYLAEFSPIPGTVEWERLLAQGIVSPEMDPLLTNNTVFFRKFVPLPRKEMEELLRIARWIPGSGREYGA